MTIASLIDTPSELTDSASSKTAIVLMTRIRLARNLAGRPFPGPVPELSPVGSERRADQVLAEMPERDERRTQGGE